MEDSKFLTSECEQVSLSEMGNIVPHCIIHCSLRNWTQKPWFVCLKFEMSVKFLCEAIKCVLVGSIPADSPGWVRKGRKRREREASKRKREKGSKRNPKWGNFRCPGAGWPKAWFLRALRREQWEGGESHWRKWKWWQFIKIFYFLEPRHGIRLDLRGPHSKGWWVLSDHLRGQKADTTEVLPPYTLWAW